MAQVVALGAAGTDLAVADLEGNGRPDIVSLSTSAISIVRNLDGGAYSDPAAYDLAQSSSAGRVAIGDVDGDGRLDVVAAGASATTVAIFSGDGQGGVRWRLDVPLTDFPTNVAAADLNHDGKADVVVTLDGGSVQVILGTALQPLPGWSGQTSGRPLAVAVGDFDGDGIPDIAVSTYNSNIDFFKGHGDGTFDARVSTAANGAGESMVAVDLDGDHNLDLVLASDYSGTCLLELFGAGDGTFQAQLGVNIAAYLDGVAVIDANNDTHPDIAAAAYGDGYLALDDATGTLRQAQALAPPGQGSNYGRVAAADMDGDGRADIVLLEGGTALIWHNQPTQFFARTWEVLATYPTLELLGDLDGDGKPDLLTFSGYSGAPELLYFRGAGDGTFGNLNLQAYPGSAPAVATLADFTADGKLDLAAVDSSGALQLLAGLGDGGFASDTSFTVGAAPTAMVTADLDHDGRTDLAVASNTDGNVTVLQNTASGWTQHAYTVGSQPSAMAAVDVTGDGALDLVVTNFFSSTVSVLAGDGGAGFASQRVYNTSAYPGFLATGDLNGDGAADLVVGSGDLNNTPVIAIHLNDGLGRFNTESDISITARPVVMWLEDFDGDGHLDVVFVDSSSLQLVVLSGNGDGTFQPPAAYGTEIPYTYGRSASLGDVDGDGHLDIAAPIDSEFGDAFVETLGACR